MKQVAKAVAAVAVATAIGGCTAPLVIKTAGEYHSGYTDSTKTLANRQAALVSLQRTKLTYKELARLYPPPTGSELLKFQDYVCAQPTGLMNAGRGIQAMTAVDKVANATATAPAKDIGALSKGLIKDFGKLPTVSVPDPDQSRPLVAQCRMRVQGFASLTPDALPGLEDRTSAPAGVIPIAAIAAALAVLQAGGVVLTDILQVAEESARAKRFLNFVRDDRTQEAVDKAFGLIQQQDNETDVFCRRYEELCTAEPSSAIASDVADEPKRPYTIMDGITVGQRWAALWRAWIRYRDYKDLLAGGRGSVGGSFAQAEADRRAALDQAISDYMAIPSAGDIVAAQKKAWDKLTDLANGKITVEEGFGAMAAFAERAAMILGDAKKVSDAKDNYDKAINPSAK